MKITSSMFIYLVLLERKWRSENISNASKVLPLKDARCGVSLRCCSPKDPPQFSPAQSPSCVQCSVTPWTVAHQASLSITISWSSLKCSNSCPWSRWCHPTISSSVFPFSSCLQSFPASFPTNTLIDTPWPLSWETEQSLKKGGV